MTTVAKRTKPPVDRPPADEGDVPDEGAVTTDSLAQDVADETLEYLPGTPELLPILNIPRRRRAEVYAMMGRISALQRELKAKKAGAAKPEDLDDAADGEADTVTEIDPEDFGKQYQVVVLVEDYLRLVAPNEAEFETWAMKVSDANLIKTFNIYLRKSQPGEADSSTS